MINVTGGVISPTGVPLRKSIIELICINSPLVIKGSKSIQTSDNEDNHSFPLLEGEYRVYVRVLKGEDFYKGDIKVSTDMTGDYNINDLLNNYQTVEDEECIND